jgi:hypothetical protein
MSVGSGREGFERCGLVAGLAAAALLAFAFDAAAEGEPDLFTIRPTFAATAVADDNPELARKGGNTSIGAWLQPNVKLGYHAPLFDLGADIGVDVRRYSGYDSGLSDEFGRVGGWGEARLAPGVAFRVANAWAPRSLRLGRPEDDGVNLVQTNQLDASLRHWRSLPGERELEVGVESTYFVSDDFSEPLGGGAVDQDFRANYVGGTGYVEVQTPVAGEVKGYLRAQAGYRSLLDASEADYADVGGSLGLRVPFGKASRFEIGGGAGWLGFTGLSDRPRATGLMKLRLALPGGFVSTIGVEHLLSANIEGRKFQQTEARVEIERYFGKRTAAAIAGFGTRFDDASLGAADLFGGGEARVRYQMTRASQIVVRYRYWTNRGDYSADDFTQNRATLELRFSPPVQ